MSSMFNHKKMSFFFPVTEKPQQLSRSLKKMNATKIPKGAQFPSKLDKHSGQTVITSHHVVKILVVLFTSCSLPKCRTLKT